MSTADEDDSFPELDALREQLLLKHRRLLWILGVTSFLLIVVGAVLMWISQDPEKLGYALPGFFLIALGVLGVARMLLSKFTDHDLKDHGEFVGVAFPSPDEDNE